MAEQNIDPSLDQDVNLSGLFPSSHPLHPGFDQDTYERVTQTGAYAPSGSVELPPQPSTSSAHLPVSLEGQQSEAGPAPKRKIKSAPRTSQACVRCRKMKMRCEGAENAPCKRCRKAKTDCTFDKKADFVLNPEDQAWQRKIEDRVGSMENLLNQILLTINGQGGTLPTPGTATASNTAFDSIHPIREEDSPEPPSAGMLDSSTGAGASPGNYVGNQQEYEVALDDHMTSLMNSNSFGR